MRSGAALDGTARGSAISWRELSVVAVVLIVCLAPFLDRALHVDDPVYVWVGQQIQAQPLDFYGFEINWTGEPQPLHEVNKNPPLVSYFLALAGSLLGWSERALHLAFLLPALAAAWGTYVLACRLSTRPLLAALATVLTPCFLLSSTTLMSDVSMVALWVWSVALWDRGLRAADWRGLLAASVLAGLCPLTKYFGIALLPLLFVYGLLVRRRLGAWSAFLLIPLAMLAAYHFATTALYGRSLLVDAVAYAGQYRPTSAPLVAGDTLTSLAFMGGCAATVLFLAPWLCGRRMALAALAVAVAIGLGVAAAPAGEGAFFRSPVVESSPALLLQVALWATVGLGVLSLALADTWKSRDSESILLLLWVLGTFVFAGFLYWSVNGRSILPLLPAAGILVARRIDRQALGGWRASAWAQAVALGGAGLLALAVTWADYRLAGASRLAAQTIVEEYGSRRGAIWFLGHWGFQYYAEQLGARPLDRVSARVEARDVVVRPENNSYLFRLPEVAFVFDRTIRVPVPSWIASMSPDVGAGFYASTWGPLPFAVGSVPPESYRIFLAKTSVGP